MRLSFNIIIEAIDTVCQLTGSAAHVGIGSDFDGGFGAESIPQELETTTDLLTIADGLRERGYEEADVEAIMGENMLRKLRECLP
jgi:membrane dipeptidase